MGSENYDLGWLREGESGEAIDTTKYRALLAQMVEAHPEEIIPGLNTLPEPDGTFNVTAIVKSTGKLARMGSFRLKDILA